VCVCVCARACVRPAANAAGPTGGATGAGFGFGTTVTGFGFGATGAGFGAGTTAAATGGFGAARPWETQGIKDTSADFAKIMDFTKSMAAPASAFGANAAKPAEATTLNGITFSFPAPSGGFSFGAKASSPAARTCRRAKRSAASGTKSGTKASNGQGSTATSAPAAPASFGGFGAAASATPTTSGFTFGTRAPAAPATYGGSAFGTKPADLGASGGLGLSVGAFAQIHELWAAATDITYKNKKFSRPLTGMRGFDFETCWRDWKWSGFGSCAATDITYKCELVVDGKMQVSLVKASHLCRLPGKPSNSLPELPPEQEGEKDKHDSNAGKGGKESPWKVGTLVRLLDNFSESSSNLSSSHLAPGRGPRSIGCIASVDLKHNKVSVLVSAGLDRSLTDCSDVKIGDQVRLASGYAAVYDAVQGPMVPGQTASVKGLQDGLVLVESGSPSAKWWYEPAALVLLSPAERAAALVKGTEHVLPSAIAVGRWVRATVTFTTNSKEAKEVRKGSLGKVASFDKNGNAWIDFEGLDAKQGVLKSNFGNILVQEDVLTLDMKDLQTVFTENVGDVPSVEVHGYIVGGARKVAARLQGPARAPVFQGANVKMSGSDDVSDDVPEFPHDEARLNETLYSERIRDEQSRMLQVSAKATAKAKMMREDSTDSTTFYDCDVYQVISDFQDLVSWRDRGGNTVAHHLAMADMQRSLRALYAENKELRWVENDCFETPQSVCDGLRAMTPRLLALHRALHNGCLLQTGSAPVPAILIRAALRWPEDDEGRQLAPEVRQMEDALAEGRADEVLVLACQASLVAQGRLYSALAMLELKYSPKQIQLEMRQYLEAILEDGEAAVSPLLYYIRFRLYQDQASKSSLDRHQAACAVAALRCFPAFAARWLKDHDPVRIQRLVDGQHKRDDDNKRDDDSGDEEDLLEADEECDAAAEWRVAKADHKLTSKSMDELMKLTGLREIKRKAMGIVKEVLLQRDRPASVKAETSMNFLFTGNPGCGKTTVARLLASCLSELGFRAKGGLVETSAQDILKLKDPASDFQAMFESVKGGTLFIDEAYRFSPAKAGQQPNGSNQVLDYLLEAVEKQEIRDSTTVILAGYRDEIEDLLAYNVGFASRFPLEFAFEDYNQKQLREILQGMVKARGMQLERKSVCGVPIADVVSRRIYQGAGKKGFGNARAVRNKLEQIISTQSQRIGTLKLRKQPVAEKDYQTLTALDAIGPRPNFASSAPMRDLNAMAGLSAIKAEFRKLLLMAQQNYDREMRGDAPETISMHRVFYGNPGTGKSTVAKLYGALLKELGLLSKGDFIAVTPADLTGDAEGGAATNTKAVLERAKGKVLLIDEAYILDPRRKNNQYGGNVLDTLVEKLDGEAGSDIAVILAGYKQEMFDMLDNNPGLRRRFNIDDFGMHFRDMSDEELKQVLVPMANVVLMCCQCVANVLLMCWWL